MLSLVNSHSAAPDKRVDTLGKPAEGRRGSHPLNKVIMRDELDMLGAEDRIAVLNMVKEGEASIDEAVAKVKAEVIFKRAARGGKLDNRFNRRGAVKKYRGRLNLRIRLEKAGVNSSLVVDLEDARDLEVAKDNGMTSPYVKMFLTYGSATPKKKLREKKVQKTSVHSDTRNPIFKEGYSWEIKGQSSETNTRLHIQIHDFGGRMKRCRFLGGMSFLVSDIRTMGNRIGGWFRLLDQKRAATSNRKYIFKMKAVAQASSTDPVVPPSPVSPSPPSAIRDFAVDSSTTQPAQVASEVSAADSAATMPMVPSMKVEDFNYLKVLGQGSFGKVMLAEHRTSSDVYAVKVIGKKEVIEDDDVEATMTERRVLELAGGCQFLTKVFATFQTPERLCYVMELVSGGDLMFHIQQTEQFSVQQVQFYTGEIFVGLSYLHSNNVIYRDLKLDNVMLAASGHIKIADFGMCKENLFAGEKTTTFCGTPGYLAPEIISERPYDKSVDFWSLGIMVYEMLLGESPFDSDDDEELFKMILNQPIHFPDSLAEDTVSLLKGLLHRDETKRLGCGPNGFNNMKNHAFFSNLDWNKLENGEIEPPFVPKSCKDPRDADNFDTDFTSIDPELDPIDPEMVRQFNQEQFKGFSFVNMETFASLSTSSMIDDDSAVDSKLAEVKKAEAYWFRPKAKRKHIAELLKGTAIGTFYVRESNSHENGYALTVNVGETKPWNGLVSTIKRSDGKIAYRLFPGTKFQSLAHAIEFYRNRSILRTPNDVSISLVLPTY